MLRAQRPVRDHHRHLIGRTERDDVDDLVVTRPDGRPYHPSESRGCSGQRCPRRPFPSSACTILRHTWARLALQAGIPDKAVQDRLGQSTVAITLYVCSHVTAQLQIDAADAVAALIAARGPV